jgi:chaperone modulatory protein CbpM
MKSKELIVIFPETLDDNAELNIEEVCSACRITPEFVQALIAEGIIEPRIKSESVYFFPGSQLKLIRTAARLHQDLEINYAGVGLALELMRELQDLRVRMRLYERGL